MAKTWSVRGRIGRAFAYSSGLCTLGLVGSGYSYFYMQHKKGMISENAKLTFDPKLISSRQRMIDRLKKERFDIIVIGGGATGSGVALEAATRGLKCALLEYDDFGSGTSSRSTKLLHGGVRYLEQAFKELDVSQLSLVLEALREREHMLKCAKFMATPIPIIMPIYKLWQIPYFWVGIKSYDLLAKLVCCGDTGVPSCYYLSRSNTLHNFPLLQSNNLKSSLVYFDGMHNDSRMSLLIALTSSIPNYVENQEGAVVVNHTGVIDILKEGGTGSGRRLPKAIAGGADGAGSASLAPSSTLSSSPSSANAPPEASKQALASSSAADEGDVIGVRVEDKLSGENYNIFGKVVINCSGPFADQLRSMSNSNNKPLITPSAGVHIVIPKWYSPTHCGLIIPETSDGRVLFFLPWENSVVAGTTDVQSPLTHLPVPNPTDVDFIVGEAARYIKVDGDVLKKDISAAWSGLRPLMASRDHSDLEKSGKTTSKITRSHSILVDDGGMISVVGGKWTTYRRMAQEAVDKALEVHADKIATRIHCRTKCLELIGSRDPANEIPPEEVLPGSGSLPLRLQRYFDGRMNLEQCQYLVRNYGFRSLEIVQLIENEKDERKKQILLKPIIDDQPAIYAEVLFAVRGEMACTIPDVVGRRLRLAFIDAQRTAGVIDQVADLMGKELKWTSSEKKKAIEEGHQFVKTMHFRPLGSVAVTEEAKSVALHHRTNTTGVEQVDEKTGISAAGATITTSSSFQPGETSAPVLSSP